MAKKFEFTEETIEIGGVTLHRIRALVAFGNVEAGNLGGFIEKIENLSMYGNAWVYGNAKVFGCADYIVFKNFWSSGRWFTWTRSNNMWRVGCFYGTGEELVKKAYKDSERSGREYERVVKYVQTILDDERKEAGNE